MFLVSCLIFYSNVVSYSGSEVNAAGDRTTKSGIIKLSNIREIIDKVNIVLYC